MPKHRLVGGKRTSRRARFETLEDRLVLAAITVNSDSDGSGFDNNGQLTLREAIAIVNGDYLPPTKAGEPDDREQINTFATLGTNDTIDFSSSTFGTGPGLTTSINVSNGLPTLDAPVTIDGALGGGVRLRLNAAGGPVTSGLFFNVSHNDHRGDNFAVRNLELEGFESAPLVLEKFADGVVFTITNVRVANSGSFTNSPGIDVRDAPIGGGLFGEGRLSITNSQIVGNYGDGIRIVDTFLQSTTPSSADNTISNNTVTGNGIGAARGSGISVSNLARVNVTANTVTGNGASVVNPADAKYGIFVAGSTTNANISDNTVTTPSHYDGVYVADSVAVASLISNTITTTNESAIVVQSAGRKVSARGNTFQMTAHVTGAPVIPPVDFLDDGLPELFNPNAPANGLDAGILNTPTILEDEITIDSAGVLEIPYRSRLGSFGNYRFDLYKVTGTLWQLVESAEINNVSAADSRFRFVVQPAVLQLGDSIALMATGVTTGGHVGYSSELAFASQTSLLKVKNVVPKLLKITTRSTNWTTGGPAVLFDSTTGPRTLPVFQTGNSAANRINVVDVTYSKPMIPSQSGLRLFYRNGASGSFSLGPTNFIENPDNDPLTNDIRYVFGDLPSSKYELRIFTSSTNATDLGGLQLDGEVVASYGVMDDYADDQYVSLGDDNAGGLFRLPFSIHYGDVNGDGIVSTSDVGDMNRDGAVNAADTTIRDAFLGSRLQTTKHNGDYDDNEIIDINDYMIWRDAYGATGPTSTLPADGSSNGVVDAVDYAIWRDIWISGPSADVFSSWRPFYAGGTSSAATSGAELVQFTAAPRVKNVVVSGSQSAHAAFSFDTVDGSGAQLQTVPVGAADTISIVFSEDVRVSAGDLTLRGLGTGNVPQLAPGGFTYDIASMTASWRFTNWSLGDRYALSLSDSVTDIEGHQLDGEWVNPSSRTSTSSAISNFTQGSGNGSAGGDFIFVMTLLPGDANLDGRVENFDLDALLGNWGLNNAIFQNADWDGNGVVDNGDLDALLGNWGANLLGPLDLLADFDNDLDVDAADLAQWDYYYGTPSAPNRLLADLDGDGDVDLADRDYVFDLLGLDVETELTV